MKISRTYLPVVISLAVALLTWGTAAKLVSVARDDAAQARVAVTKALKDASASQHVADSLSLQVAALRSERDAAISRAVSARRNAAHLTARYDSLANAAPDTCLPIVITADSALAAKDSVIALDSLALQRSIASEQKLQTAVDTLTAALTKLRGAATTLVKADEKLSRRTSFLRWLPKPGVGATLGLDADGKPHTVAGLTFGWSF